jgi:hypothetical protein
MVVGEEDNYLRGFVSKRLNNDSVSSKSPITDHGYQQSHRSAVRRGTCILSRSLST